MRLCRVLPGLRRLRATTEVQVNILEEMYILGGYDEADLGMALELTSVGQ